MQRITGLPDEQVLAYEAQAEAALRAALEAVMDKIARRIEAHAPVALLASVLVAAPGDQGDIIPPEDVPAGDGLPPGQPYVSPDDLASIPPLWQEAVAQQVLPIVAQVFLDAAGRTYAGMVEASSIAGLPSVGSLAAEQYLARAQNTFEKVGDDLWATARTELSDGFERGESIPQLAERLRASAGVTARTGVLVARTQVNEASNAGSFAVAQASGLAMQKEWIATPDIRTRPTHLAADGQRVDLNEPFVVGGFSAMFPAAPTLPPAERYNCRCTIGYVMPDRAPAQVRHDDVQTQELADLPGTTTVDDLAAAQSARLQQIIDEQHAAVEGVVQDVHQQFRDRFGKAGGPGLGDLGPEAVVDPRAIRAPYRQAGTLDDLRTAWQDEMRRITSRDIIVQLPPGASVLTMRQYAEGVTQMLERFPEARLRKISWWSDGTTSDYARIARGSATIEFNAYWAADIHRAEYLRALRADVKGWTGPERSGWSVRGATTPQATAYHEFAHILDIETLSDGAKYRALDIVRRRAVVRGVADDELIATDISAYAGSNGNELIAEAMTDVMVNGARASAASREIYDLIVADYKARGLAVRTTTHAADVLTEEELAQLGEVLPKAAAAGGLNAKTVAQLRALAKERGIVVPAGARKADLVKALSEPTPSGAAAMPTLEVRTSLTAAEQARVKTLVRRDPQIFATVQDRYGPISTSGNLSDADAAWLEQIYRRDRVFVERAVQEAHINRTIVAEAKKLGITPTQYRAREAEKLKTLVDDKPIIVRRGERGLQDILASGRFKTSLETGRRQPGLTVAKDRRELGESIMGVSPDVPLAERPVYGYVGIRGVEPALSPGKKIAGLAQREGQEDLLSSYGQIEVVLKPEVRARTTVTVGDSLDEMGFVRPSPIDKPTADSVYSARRLDAAISEPDWTRRSYVEAQIHSGVRREDILEVVFPDDPAATMVAQLREAGIPWRVLRKGDAPIFPTQVVTPPVLDEKALLRAAARERNRLIESSQGTAKLLAELDELIANKATKAAIRQRLDPALIAPEQVFAGADPAIVDALRKALDTGDPAKLRSAITRAGTKAKLKPVSKAGAKATFDAETMEGVGGIEIAPGVQVTVVRRGTTLTLPDGSTMQLTRAQVTPIAPKPAPVKAIKATKRAPRAAATPQPAAQIEAHVRTGVAKVEPMPGGKNATTELVTFNDGTQAVRKTMRAAEGQSASAQADAEEMAARMLRAFGIRAPETYRAGAKVVYQERLIGTSAKELPRVPGSFDVAGGYYESDEGRIIGLVDALTDNYDRNAGNWLVGVEGEHLGVIDHGFAFQWGKKAPPSQAPFSSMNPFDRQLSKPVPNAGEWAANDYSPADIATARRILDQLRPDFERLGRPDWYDKAVERLGYIEQHATGTKVRIKPLAPIKATKRAPAVKAPTKAVARQAAIDEARQVGDLAAEVLELSNNGASVAALRSRITNAAARLGTPDEVRDALLEVTSRTGDVLQAEALKQLEAAGITPIGTAGQVVKFDRKIHAPIPGVKTGDLVIVDRPGLTLTRDGEKIQLSKAKVGPAPEGSTVPLTSREFEAKIKTAAKRKDALDAAPSGMRYTPAREPGDFGETTWRNIDDEQSQYALDGYVGNDFDLVNRGLRKGFDVSTPDGRLGRELVPDIDQAFDHSRLTHDIELWRSPGSGRGIFGDPGTWGDDLAGFEWTDPAYSSTSASRAVADRFTKDGGVRLRMLAPRGTKAIQLSEMPGRGAMSVQEAEMLLARGARFRVVRDHGWTEITHPTTHQRIRVRDLDIEVSVPEETPPLP